MSDKRPWPTEIRLGKDRRQLSVRFDDGIGYDLPAEMLRVLSPSAEVQGHSAEQRQTVPGKIDVLIGHRDIEGLTLEGIKADYRSLSPDSFGLHAMGFIYFAHERAFSLPGNLENILTGIAKGWDAAYSDYDRTIPLVAGSIDAKSSPALVSRFMDVQRRCLRPFGTRFGELDLRRLRILQSQLLQRRIIKQPVDLTRAATYDILTETYRKESNTLTRIEP